jgi:dTDP-4-amino-4,6-dideoxygalactose transaminase
MATISSWFARPPNTENDAFPPRLPMPIDVALQARATIPVMRPHLPAADELLPYLRRIDEARYYTNHGTLLRDLESRLAAFYGVAASQIAVVANGTVALSAALLAVGARPGSKCLLPSWTFVGSAAAAWAANLRPHFVDVDEATWMLDPLALGRRPDLSDVGAVMVVSAFGSPVDTLAWDAFTADTGVPVVIDCAASFDTVRTVPSARPGTSPIMVSLHATKAFGVGEGGLVLSTDDDTIQRFNQICNFGVWQKPGQILGYNGKESEYHCAVGLAMLDRWEERRRQLDRLTQHYHAALSGIERLSLLPRYGKGWVSCYCNVKTTDSATRLIDRLTTAGISTRRWWQSGVHVQEAYRDFPRDPLPVTEYLAERVVGVPFFHDMTDAQFHSVIEAVRAH